MYRRRTMHRRDQPVVIQLGTRRFLPNLSCCCGDPLRSSSICSGVRSRKVSRVRQPQYRLRLSAAAIYRANFVRWFSFRDRSALCTNFMPFPVVADWTTEIAPRRFTPVAGFFFQNKGETYCMNFAWLRSRIFPFCSLFAIQWDVAKTHQTP